MGDTTLVQTGQLNRAQSITAIGKYLTEKVYQFYKRDVLQAEKWFTFKTYFESLFDYIFLRAFKWTNVINFMSAVRIICVPLTSSASCKTLLTLLAIWRTMTSYWVSGDTVNHTSRPNLSD